MRIRPATFEQRGKLGSAVYHLRIARDLLRAADCPKSLARVRLALSSAKGAERHMSHRYHHTKNQPKGLAQP